MEETEKASLFFVWFIWRTQSHLLDYVVCYFEFNARQP